MSFKITEAEKEVYKGSLALKRGWGKYFRAVRYELERIEVKKKEK